MDIHQNPSTRVLELDSFLNRVAQNQFLIIANTSACPSDSLNVCKFLRHAELPSEGLKMGIVQPNNLFLSPDLGVTSSSLVTAKHTKSFTIDTLLKEMISNRFLLGFQVAVISSYHETSFSINMLISVLKLACTDKIGS
uniref:Uncharacterized protein n=1 Tax=Daucus carota subsp. sativus TaxID=79200 RepID=A0A175YHS9_DAUCS